MKSGRKKIAVIMAGGSGTRLWPRSRSAYPKHVLALKGRKTLIQQTVERLTDVVDGIAVVTEKKTARLVKRQLKDYKHIKYIVEPMRKGTAAAIALSVTSLPASTLIFLPADHYIEDVTEFRKSVVRVLKEAQMRAGIVLLGLKPTYPSTGYGYIRAKGGRVAQFIEKPDMHKAVRLIKDRNVYWNLGMFGATSEVFRREFEAHMPGLLKKLSNYRSISPETFDYGVLERSKNVFVVPASFDWHDIGSFADLYDVLKKDENFNVFVGPRVDIDSVGCYIYSDSGLVATVGLKDLIIVKANDIVMVAPKDRAQDVKILTEKLKDSKKHKYL